jgi:hypothetical protein
MKNITYDEFQTSIWGDPAWAATLREPVMVVDDCVIKTTKITHLSPLLHFAGKAGFEYRSIKVAEGTFHKLVSFRGSSIQKIGKLTLLGTPPLRCDLTLTPFFQRNPLKALEIMTGSTDIKVWEEVKKVFDNSLMGGSAMEVEDAIALVKKKRMMDSLKKDKRGLRLEI